MSFPDYPEKEALQPANHNVNGSENQRTGNLKVHEVPNGFAATNAREFRYLPKLRRTATEHKTDSEAISRPRRFITVNGIVHLVRSLRWLRPDIREQSLYQI